MSPYELEMHAKMYMADRRRSGERASLARSAMTAASEASAPPVGGFVARALALLRLVVRRPGSATLLPEESAGNRL